MDGCSGFLAVMWQVAVATRWSNSFFETVRCFACESFPTVSCALSHKDVGGLEDILDQPCAATVTTGKPVSMRHVSFSHSVEAVLCIGSLDIYIKIHGC